MTDEEWDRDLAVNLNGPFYLCRDRQPDPYCNTASEESTLPLLMMVSRSGRTSYRVPSTAGRRHGVGEFDVGAVAETLAAVVEASRPRLTYDCQ